jgi:hypothetical protein
MKDGVTRAQVNQAKQVNENHCEGSVLEAGDCVSIEARNITTQKTCKKENWKCICQYEILRNISPWA